MSAPSASEVAWAELDGGLRAYVRRRVADAHAVDDIIQVVLEKLAQRLRRRGMPDNVAAWVFRVAHNAVVDHHRARAPAAELPDDLAAETARDGEWPRTHRLHQALRAFVHALPPRQREALLLTEYEGLTQVQLAERLRIPVSSAKSRVQRARKRLQQALLRCCEFELDRRGNVVDWRRRAGGSCDGC